MADTTLLRSSAIVRNSSVGTSPPAAPRGPVKTGELPLVQVKMGPGGPQVLTPQPKAVEILPPRDANSANVTGGLPMVSVKMTSRGPQPDDGRDSAVMILPPKDQKHAIAVGGLPMAQLRATPASPQVQSLPNVQSAGPQIQAPPPALSHPRGAGFAMAALGQGPQRGSGYSVAPSGQARVVRVAAPRPARAPVPVPIPIPIALPPVPEFPVEQLMLCRYLVGKYLADIAGLADMRTPEIPSPATECSTEVTVPADPGVTESIPATVKEGPDNGAANISLAEATIVTIDQALVTGAVRAEAEAKAAAAAAATLAEVQEIPETVQPPVTVLQTAPGASIIPAAPTASYVAGRVGDRPHGYAGGRVQRNAAMAPRRVPKPGALPPVIVKMENGRSVVQNKAEVDAVREAVAAAAAAQVPWSPQHPSMPVVAAESSDGSVQG